MKRAASLVPVLTLGLFTQACGLFAAPESVAPTRVARPAAKPSETKTADVAPADTRRVGDFTVHRFSGSYQKTPLTLTEEIVAKEGVLWVIDDTFEEQSGTTKLRVRFDPKTERVVRVSKLDSGVESKVPLATYDQWIERTSFAADANDGLLGSAKQTCLVGASELECETKTYNVRVGEQRATLSVSQSASVPTGDVMGDITSPDGAVIYRSELVEIGNTGAPKHGVASR